MNQLVSQYVFMREFRFGIRKHKYITGNMRLGLTTLKCQKDEKQKPSGVISL